MGLRGPGAKPVHRQSRLRAKSPKLQPWEEPGLSRAEKVVAFIQTLPVTSGKMAGSQFTLRPFQRDIIEAIYKTDDNGKRIVREALITMPRKNGKTGLTAAITLCHLAGPEAVQRGQVYSAGADRSQSALLYAEMTAIVQRVEWLSDRIIIRDFKKQLEDTETDSVYYAISADPKSKHGFSASCWIYDELAQAQNRKLYDVLSTSTGAREEPLGIVISTQSSDPLHIMSQQVDYAAKVQEGIYEDPSFYSYMAMAPETADPWDEKTWFDCNPALGDFRDLEEMRDFARKAKRIPEQETAFRLFYLNQRFSPAELKYIQPRDWKACATDEENIESLKEELHGAVCYGALDLAETTNDLTSFQLVFPREDGMIAWPFFFTTSHDLDSRETRDRAPYSTWIKQGYLEVRQGKVMDYEFLANRIAELTSDFDLQMVAADPWHLDKFQEGIEAVGADHIKLFKHPQDFKGMDPAIRVLENLVLNVKLKHTSNPMMQWCLDNVRIVRDAAGNRRFDKQHSRGRIDGIVTLAMAANLCDEQMGEQNYVEGSLVMV